MPAETIKIASRDGGSFDCYLATPAATDTRFTTENLVYDLPLEAAAAFTAPFCVVPAKTIAVAAFIYALIRFGAILQYSRKKKVAAAAFVPV